MKFASWSTFLSCFVFALCCQAQQLPEFKVPGHESEMNALGRLFQLHHAGAFTNCTLWDAWLPQATVWTGPGPRDRYRQSLLTRRIDEEGYVSMQQHRGMAHSDGWPFPAWQQSTGQGFHFSILGEEWAIQNFNLKPLNNTEGWEIEGAQVMGIDPQRGLQLRATSDRVSITTPVFQCGTIVAPFARLEWAAQGLSAESQPRILWLMDDEKEWNATRFSTFPPLKNDEGLQYANVPLYRHPGYGGLLKRYRLVIDHASGSQIDLKSIITAIDTRHPTTNWNYLQACCSYFNWTGDLDFLQANIVRMRKALRFGIEEFGIEKEKHVLVRWVGHEGKTGLVRSPDGKKRLLPGLGVGNNYWDLLPFGGHDAIATMLAYDALRQMAQLERALESNSQSSFEKADPRLNADSLAKLADEVRVDFQQRFWNEQNGRFVGWIDIEGKPQDYGFSFVNLEAIHYGLASAQQARSIFEWLDGQRTVAGDTSTGKDIYRWRFAPRATTRRNVETYCWVWSGPETIEWGNQVQDGGAVLGFSYHDLMARIKTKGADDAWMRLQAILNWFVEVEAEGGYRAYYEKPGRGLLQGGGPPGGLGMDQEFLESVLVPQVMLYGFLGFEPTAEGFVLDPKLPAGWPSLTINRVHSHGYVLNIVADKDGSVSLQPIVNGKQPLVVRLRNASATLEPDQILKLSSPLP